MKLGLDWYKREPVAFLGGVQGLTVRQHAVYSVILDLLYMHGGEIPNDPKFVSGYFKDLGPAGVRTAIADLVKLEKLIENDGKITQKRVKNEAKTKEELRKTRKKAGEEGGKKSGQSRKNNSLDEASASEKGKQIREEGEKRRGEETPEGVSNSSLALEIIPPNGFEDFWGEYPHPPNRGSKQKAKTLFEGLSPTDQKAVLASLEQLNEYLAVATWRSAQMATTFLNHKNRNWENEYDIEAERRKSGGSSRNDGPEGQGGGTRSIFDEF